MITRATMRAMLKRAERCRTAQRHGWPLNSKDALLRLAADDIERLVAEVGRLKDTQRRLRDQLH